MSNEYEVQKEMVRSLESVSLRLWGQWNGSVTRPRWRCNEHLNHEFFDTVDNVANREKEFGTGCPQCVRLLERPVIPFEEFAESASKVIDARAKSEQNARARAKRASVNRLMAS